MALVTITAIKDNVQFGSITLMNPQKNQYTWGIIPTINIEGKSKGNIYTFGLLGEKMLMEIIQLIKEIQMQ